MASLTNITVIDADLVKVQPDIADFRFSTEANFADEIASAKDRLHRKLQDTRALTDDQMALVKDVGTSNIKTVVIYETIADIFLQNGMTERSEMWSKKAKDVPLSFYVDDNSDGTIADSEKDFRPNITFSR